MNRSASTQQRIVVTAFVIMMLDAMGIGIVIPVMPDLLLEVDPALDVARAATIGGWVTSLYATMQFLCGAMLGALSDRWGRRVILLASLCSMVLYYVILARTDSIIWVFIGRAIGGISGATQSTLSAVIADISSSKEKSQRFGYLSAGFGTGFVLGPVLGGLLGEIGTRVPFVIAASCALVSVVMTSVWLPETLDPKNQKSFCWRVSNPLGAFVSVSQLQGVATLLMVFASFMLANSIYASLWPYFTVKQFGWSSGMIGVSLAVYGSSFALVQMMLVKWCVRRFSEVPTIAYSLLFEAVTTFAIAWITAGWLLLSLTVLAAMATVGQPVLQSLLSQSVGKDQQGLLQGVLASIQALAMMIGPPLWTWIFFQFTHSERDYVFAGAPFIGCAGLLIVAWQLFIQVYGVSKRSIQNSKRAGVSVRNSKSRT